MIRAMGFFWSAASDDGMLCCVPLMSLANAAAAQARYRRDAADL